ncbi:hypothetical protein Peur_036847 [Populus x canadensis]
MGSYLYVMHSCFLFSFVILQVGVGRTIFFDRKVCLQRAENQTLSRAVLCCDVYWFPLHRKIREIWRFSNKLHLFCPVKYQFPDCFMTADAAHNSDCNLHLCFIQPDDVENVGGYRAWNMVCSWNICGCWLNYTEE